MPDKCLYLKDFGIFRKETNKQNQEMNTNELLTQFEQFLKVGIKNGFYVDEDSIYDAIDDYCTMSPIRFLPYSSDEVSHMLHSEIDMEKFILFF